MVNLTESLDRLLESFLESQSPLWDSYVDPRDAYVGPDGEVWDALSGSHHPDEDVPYRTCTELFQIQSCTRFLARENEFAINGHENRINYIVGKSHTYTIVGREDDVPDQVITKVQAVLDKILKVNHWKRRQREIKLRDDRDGETFIRKFYPNDGLMRFRFVEPRSVQPPSNEKDNQSFGIETEDDDIESVVAYFIDGDEVKASDVQHRKFNVDSSMKRGLPLMWPVRKNLSRAARLLRNMSMATEIQTAIALIRKHQQATKEAVRSFVSANAAQQIRNSEGKTENVLRYPPGSILDTPQGQEYDIPKQLDPTKTVAALQAELRAVAARLVMPEFMLTSDASNANYSSTMVAEGPAVRNFEALQCMQIEDDLELLNEALEHAAKAGLITIQELNMCEISVEPPSVHVRDKLQEAQVRQLDMAGGILSPQTAAGQANLDYDQEQTNIELHQERGGSLPMLPKLNADDITYRPAASG